MPDISLGTSEATSNSPGWTPFNLRRTGIVLLRLRTVKTRKRSFSAESGNGIIFPGTFGHFVSTNFPITLVLIFKNRWNSSFVRRYLCSRSCWLFCCKAKFRLTLHSRFFFIPYILLWLFGRHKEAALLGDSGRWSVARGLSGSLRCWFWGCLIGFVCDFAYGPVTSYCYPPGTVNLFWSIGENKKLKGFYELVQRATIF